MLLHTLEGLALALVVLGAVLVWCLAPQRPWRPRYTYEVTKSGITIMTPLVPIRFHAIPASRILGLRIQGSPGGYANARSPLKVLRILDYPRASEGVSIVCKDGWEVIVTPKSPHELLKAAAECGFPTVPSPDWRDDAVTSNAVR